MSKYKISNLTKISEHLNLAEMYLNATVVTLMADVDYEQIEAVHEEVERAMKTIDRILAKHGVIPVWTGGPDPNPPAAKDGEFLPPF